MGAVSRHRGVGGGGVCEGAVGGRQSAAVTASLYPPCHREQSSGRGPALQQASVRAHVCGGEQSGVMLQATAPLT